MLVAALVIFLTGSRSGMIGLGLQLLFIGVYHAKKVSMNVALLICVVLLGISLILPFIQKKERYEDRADIWRTAWEAGLEHPIFGGGFGNTEKLLHDASINLNNTITYQYVDSSHNVFLDFWVQGGIIGVSAIVYLVVGIIFRFIREKNIVGILGLLGVLSVMSFNPVSVVVLIEFWWLLGQSTKFQSSGKK